MKHLGNITVDRLDHLKHLISDPSAFWENGDVIHSGLNPFLSGCITGSRPTFDRSRTSFLIHITTLYNKVKGRPLADCSPDVDPRKIFQRTELNNSSRSIADPAHRDLQQIFRQRLLVNYLAFEDSSSDKRVATGPGDIRSENLHRFSQLFFILFSLSGLISTEATWLF